MGWLGHADRTIEHFIPATKKWSDGKPKYIFNNCPVCGASQDNKRVILWYVCGDWYVICADCHYHNKAAKTEEEAAKKWNNRKDD